MLALGVGVPAPTMRAVMGAPAATAPSAPIRSEVPTRLEKTLPVAGMLAAALVPSVNALASATATGISSTMAIRKNLAGPLLVLVLLPSINDT